MAETLGEQLYQALIEGIRLGRLEPGLVLLEGNIAEIFGMSRSPVRQTLGRLHDERMICRFEGRGYLVGQRPGSVVRRSLAAVDFRHAGGAASVARQDAWLAHAERVERDVVLCSMKGRFELNELQLAKSLGVSRTITHRILLYLQGLGVVEKVKYSSWGVVPLDDTRLRQLYAARRQLEPYMIALASQAMPGDSIAHYIARLDDAADRYPNLPSARLDELEHDLHQKALLWGANDEIMNMLRRTQPILLVSKHLLGTSIDLPHEEPFFEQHRRVFVAMRERQPDNASRALDAHLALSQSKVVERLGAFRDSGHVAVPGFLRPSTV